MIVVDFVLDLGDALGYTSLRNTQQAHPTTRTDMSGCQEALLLTRQATPAVPLQEVIYPLDIPATAYSTEHGVEALLTLYSHVERKGSLIASCRSVC